MNVLSRQRPARSRGRLLSAGQVLEEFFPEECRPSRRWVRENIPGSVKLTRRARPMWYEEDVAEYLYTRREPLP